jgi:hypothetical protein
MVCETRRAEGQTATDRFAEVLAATTELRALIAAGKVRVRIGPQGAVALDGWTDSQRRDISDACAYRTIAQSWEMRQAVARAEMESGRKVNERAVNLGIHSHDGGRTWHPGH